MKKIILVFISSFFAFNISARTQAYLSYATFYSPSDGTYIETYMSIYGKTVKYKKIENGKFQANIDVLFIFKQNDEIKNFQKINMKSPEISDTLKESLVDFIDVQRIAIPNGVYDFEITITDNNTSELPVSYSEKMNINIDSNKVAVSGIQLIDKFVKSNIERSISKYGFDFYPYLSDFFPEKENKINFYFEVYNTLKLLGDSVPFNINFYIEDYDSRKKIQSLNKNKKAFSSIVDVNIQTFDISLLPSGNYNLMVEVKDNDNKLLSFNSTFFQRSNPSVKIEKTDIYNIDIANTFVEKITDFDSLKLYLDYLYPKTTRTEAIFIESIFNEHKNMKDSLDNKKYVDSQIKLMQQILYDFWENHNTENPSEGWEEYKSYVNQVNQVYKAQNLKGYKSDRGRVYLKYGPPNKIIPISSSPDSYPYEIWHYYNIEKQGNKKFIFFCRKDPNNFELLHSDVFGELYQPEWERILRDRRNNSNFDIKTTKGAWGDKVLENWNNPK